LNTFIDVTSFDRAVTIGLLEDFDDICAGIQDRRVFFLIADDEGLATRPRPGLALERQGDTAVEDDELSRCGVLARRHRGPECIYGPDDHPYFADYHGFLLALPMRARQCSYIG
jgi:hypothetical protein